MAVTLEICVDDPVGLAAAVEGGADRIELCSALELGGLTPSPALLARALDTGVPVHAMVRPRAGNFIYDADELAMMSDEVERLLSMGAQGIVIGALRPALRLHAEALGRFRKAAGAATLVLHRAVDMTPDPVAATKEACTLGFDKVLSSGGETSASGGAAMLGRMVEASKGKLSVMAGSGITPANVASLIRRTGVTEVHASARTPGAAPDPRSVAMGFAAGPRQRTNADVVRKLRAAIEESE